jgi:hypothetical protein
MNDSACSSMSVYYRQRLHRVMQQYLPGRVLECTCLLRNIGYAGHATMLPRSTHCGRTLSGDNPNQQAIGNLPFLRMNSDPETSADKNHDGHRRSSIHAGLLFACTFLFLMRVLGQLIQWQAPLPYLPPFASFQGSSLPYWLLLSLQVLILATMSRYAWLVHAGRLRPNKKAGRILMWCGGFYMIGSVARIVIGITVPTAAAWFSALIPSMFHIVLAGYVIALAFYHWQPAWRQTS